MKAIFFTLLLSISLTSFFSCKRKCWACVRTTYFYQFLKNGEIKSVPLNDSNLADSIAIYKSQGYKDSLIHYDRGCAMCSIYEDDKRGRYCVDESEIVYYSKTDSCFVYKTK
jgi:hypothetical protein